MSDPDRLAEYRALLRRHAVLPDLTKECLAVGTAADWLVGEVERLRALLEPSVTMTSPHKREASPEP